MTLKKVMLRGLLGFQLGVFMGYTITILIALLLLDKGVYTPVVPLLAEVTGNEITAVVLQYGLSGLLGFAFAAGSAVFEVEEWSLTKQTVIHFIISTVAMFPIAYFTYWMRHTLWGIILYISIFVIMYIIIWAIQSYFWRKKIKGINDKINGR